MPLPKTDIISKPPESPGMKAPMIEADSKMNPKATLSQKSAFYSSDPLDCIPPGPGVRVIRSLKTLLSSSQMN